MISAGELKVPPKVDYLYVEQEVMADETSAVDAVLKADKERWDLVQEEKQLLEDLPVGGLVLFTDGGSNKIRSQTGWGVVVLQKNAAGTKL